VIYGVGTDICKLSRIESMKSLDALGKPIIEFDESIKSFINDLGIKSSHVSLSDDGGYAVAFVILEA